jgi:mycofactocin precursor
MLDNAVQPAAAAAPSPEPNATKRPTSDTDDERQSALVVDDLLVEDVSIDGMCGVY